MYHKKNTQAPQHHHQIPHAYPYNTRPFYRLNSQQYQPAHTTYNLSMNGNSHSNSTSPALTAQGEEDAAAAVAQRGGTMPKNFSKPLTCFYWYTYGSCTKPDDVCLYAHFPTGIVAAAPVSLKNTQGSVAGRNAVHTLQHEAESERLHEWEARLSARQTELDGKGPAKQKAQSGDEEAATPVPARVRKLLASSRAALTQAHGLLAAHAVALSATAMAGPWEDREVVGKAVAAMAGAMKILTRIEGKVLILEAGEKQAAQGGGEEDDGKPENNEDEESLEELIGRTAGM